MIEYLFSALFFLIPLVFYPKNSEVFEFNKMIGIYIFTSLIITAWIIKMIYQKKIIFRRTIIDIPLIIFLASQFISTIISIDTRTSLFGYYSRFNGGLLSTICYIFLYWTFVSNMDKEKIKKVLIAILSSAIIITIYGILEHFGASISCVIVAGKFNDNCWVQDVRTRVFATLGQPNWLAAYLVSLIPLTWYYTLAQKNKNKLVWPVASILFFACILFTKSRSGLLALAIAYIIFWVFNFKKNVKLFLLLNTLLLIAVLIFGTPWTPPINNMFIKGHSQIAAADTGEGGTESGAIRKIVWKGAIDIWKAHPVFGTGVETFGYSYWQFRPIEHNSTSEWDYLYNKAHNEYLNFLANSGIVGLGSYLILISFSIIQILKSDKKNILLKIALVSGFVSILITNFFGFSVVVISLFTFLFPAITTSLNIKPQPKEKIIPDTNQKIFIATILGVTAFTIFIISRYWYADYLYQKSNFDLQEKSYKLSITSLLSAIDYSPTEAIYHNQMAKTFTNLAIDFANANEATEAAKLIPYATDQSDLAFNLSPRNMNIRESRMSMYLQLASLDPRYLESAVNLVKETIPFSPTDPKLQLILGKAYANMNKLKDASDAFKKALELKPDYIDAKKDLEVIQKLQDNKK